MVSAKERENSNGRGTRAPSLNSGIVFGKAVDVTAQTSPQTEMQAKDVTAKHGGGGKDQAARQPTPR